MNKSRIAPWPLLAALMATGCGPSTPATYPVAGVVKFADGRPTPMGSVEFRHRESKTIARGTLDGEGRFTLGTLSAADGALAGDHQVIVVQKFLPGSIVASSPKQARHGVHAGHTSVLVEPKYASYESSPLTAHIKPTSDNEVELEVQRFAPPTGRR